MPSRPFGVAVELVFERRGNEWVGRRNADAGGLEVRVDVPPAGALAPVVGSVSGSASTTTPSAMPFGDSGFSVAFDEPTRFLGAQFADSAGGALSRPVLYRRPAGGSLTCQDAVILIMPTLQAP